MTVPPATAPRPCTMKGTAPARRRRSRRQARAGRRAAARPAAAKLWRRRGTSTSAPVRAATGGTKRSTVPALPTSMLTWPARSPGVPRQARRGRGGWRFAAGAAPGGGAGASSIRQPSARGRPAISRVSLAASGPVIRVGLSASAARTRARLVIDLDPGTARARGPARRARRVPSRPARGPARCPAPVPGSAPGASRRSCSCSVWSRALSGRERCLAGCAAGRERYPVGSAVWSGALSGLEALARSRVTMFGDLLTWLWAASALLGAGASQGPGRG